jgi:TP901 family phage tail tape measure protein
MPDPIDLTLGVLFRAREDHNFKRITRRLHTIVTGFQQGMRKVDVASKKVEQSLRRIEAASRRAERGLRDTGRAADFTGKQIGKVHGGIQRLIAAFKVVAVYTVAGRLFGGLQAGLRNAWEEIVNFDQALANLKAITGATSAEIAAMRETLKETALRTKFSTTEIAEGMVLLGQAGLSAGESMAAIDAVADLAAGTLSDFRNVSDLVTTSLRAFNLDATETRRVADVMANAVNKSKLTIDKLRTSFNYVGAGAAQAGLQIEQVGASMMVLANNGMRASTIGTGLRQVLARLLSPNAKLKQAMDSYGLSIDKANGKQEWFETQIGKLASVMYNFEKNTVDMSLAYKLFGLRGAQAAAILVKSYMDLDGTWSQMLAKVKEIGTAQAMMEDQAEGLGFKIKNLADDFGVLSVNMGEAGFTGGLRAAVDGLREIVKFLANNVNTNFGIFISTLLGTAGALYTVRLAFLALKQAMQFAGAGMIKFFLNPVGLVIIAISALVAAIYMSIKAIRRQRDEMNETASKSAALANSFNQYIRELDKVVEGSEEYETIIERLKQQHEDYIPLIDKLKGNYVELKVALQELAHEERKRAVFNKSKLLATDKEVLGAMHRYSKELAAAKYYGREPASLDQFLEKEPEAKKKIKDYVKMVGDVYIQQMREGKSRSEIEKGLGPESGPFGYLDTLRKQSPELVAQVYQEVIAVIDKYERQLFEAAERRRKLMTEKIESLPTEWRALLDGYWDDKNYLKYLETLDAINKAENQWVKREEQFRASSGDKFKDVGDREEAVLKLKEQHWKSHFDALMGKSDKAADAMIKDASRIQEWYVKAYGTGMDEAFYKMDQRYFKLKKQIDDVVEDEKERASYLAYMWGAYYTELQAMINSGQVPGTLFDQEYMEARLEMLRGYGAPAGQAGSRLPTKDKRAGIQQVEFKKLLEDMEKLQKKYDEEEKKRRQKAAQERMDIAEEAYRSSEMSAEDYFAALKEMMEAGLMDWKEYQEKMRREQQSTWENLKEGWKKFFRDMETHGEFMYRIGQELPEMMASNFADAFGDIATGTKKAKDAFKDMARDMLRWIAEIAAKRAMLGMLGMMFGGGGGGAPYIPASAHSGGMFGELGSYGKKLKGMHFAPKLHNGLAPDEFAAILKKDEGVFTKKQMQALGMMANGGTQISVPVNVNGQSNDALQRHLPGEIEEAVLKTMRKYM